jgi:hypothetical protein
LTETDAEIIYLGFRGGEAWVLDGPEGEPIWCPCEIDIECAWHDNECEFIIFDAEDLIHRPKNNPNFFQKRLDNTRGEMLVFGLAIAAITYLTRSKRCPHT